MFNVKCIDSKLSASDANPQKFEAIGELAPRFWKNNHAQLSA